MIWSSQINSEKLKMMIKKLCLSEYVQENEGNPAIGTILWLKQKHNIPYFVIVVNNKDVSKTYKNYFEFFWKLAQKYPPLFPN